MTVKKYLGLVIFWAFFMPNTSAQSQSTGEGIQELELARQLIYQGDSLRRLNLFQEAKLNFEKAISIYDLLGSQELMFARGLHLMAVTEHTLSQPNKALGYLERAIQVKISHYQKEDHPELVIDYALMGDILSSLNLENEAIDHLERALRITKSGEENADQYLELVMRLLSNSYLRSDDWKASLTMKQDLLQLGEQRYGPRSLQVAFTLYEIGTHYTYVQDYRSAVSNHQKAYDMLLELGDAVPPRAFYTVQFYLGINKLHIGEPGDQLISEAMGVLEEGPLKENLYQKMLLYLQAALIYRISDQPEKSLTNYQKILDLYSRPGVTLDASGNPPIEALIDYREIVPTLVGKAWSLQKLYGNEEGSESLEAAYNTILLADSLSEKLRSQPTVFRDKVEFQRITSEANSIGLDICYQLFERTEDQRFLEQAFRFSEKNKSSIVLSGLQEALYLNQSNIPDSVIQKSQTLTEALAEEENALYELSLTASADSSLVGQHQNELIRLRKEQSDWLKQIELQYPGYYQAKYGKNYIEISTIQKNLSPGDLLIAHHLDSTNLYTFIISATEVELKRVLTPHDLSAKVNYYQRLLSEPARPDSVLQMFVETSHELRKVLLPEDSLLTSYSSLLILTENLFGTIPFETLVTTSKVGSGFADPDYLLKTHTVSYANSATLWYAQRQQNQTAASKQMILAMAPSFDQEWQYTGVEADSTREGLGRLSWTQEEVNNLNDYFDTELRLGKEASEGAFKQLSSEYAVVHVASHGLLNESEPMFSKLVFAPPNAEDAEDGFLNTLEVFNLRLSADMIVLSACNSGSGEVLTGEGVFSLASGFFYAGARSIVMTYWTANDQSSTQIITDFYANLSKGLNKPRSLREAKLAYLDQSSGVLSHPYYWAHFVVNGNDAPLIRNTVFRAWWLLVLALLPVLAVIVVKKRKTA